MHKELYAKPENNRGFMSATKLNFPYKFKRKYSLQLIRNSHMLLMVLQMVHTLGKNSFGTLYQRQMNFTVQHCFVG